MSYAVLRQLLFKPQLHCCGSDEELPRCNTNNVIVTNSGETSFKRRDVSSTFRLRSRDGTYKYAIFTQPSICISHRWSHMFTDFIINCLVKWQDKMIFVKRSGSVQGWQPHALWISTWLADIDRNRKLRLCPTDYRKVDRNIQVKWPVYFWFLNSFCMWLANKEQSRILIR